MRTIMTAVLATATWIHVPCRFAAAFAPAALKQQRQHQYQRHAAILTAASTSRLFSFSISSYVSMNHCLSRLGTLQTLLNKHGAPGSRNCQAPNDLQPLQLPSQEMPELVSALTASIQNDDDNDDTKDGDSDRNNNGKNLSNLHPYLFPIAQSKASPDAFICAYRNPSTEESDKNFPWPIVETKLGGPGFRLLALNSEHLMRRIACEDDFKNGNAGNATELVTLYNNGLGEGRIADVALDAKYQVGSVNQLGYGVDKYVLLRVGPFPDLYQAMAQQHRQKGDEQSALIAAEASNKKLAGFGATFLFYARLLASFPNREDEARDAARMCLRLPLPTIGISYEDFKDVAVLGQIAKESDSMDVVLEKMSAFYNKMKEVEKEEDNNQQHSGKTRVQATIDEAGLILDEATLVKKPWSSVRKAVGEKLRSVGRNDFAQFVDNKS